MIGAYHQLWHIEKSFRMSKHDLRARPICHHKRESIDAHLNIVFAALAVTRLIEDRTGWSIKRFVRTTHRYRTVNIRAGHHVLTAEDPLPDDLRVGSPYPPLPRRGQAQARLAVGLGLPSASSATFRRCFGTQACPPISVPKSQDFAGQL